MGTPLGLDCRWPIRRGQGTLNGSADQGENRIHADGDL